MAGNHENTEIGHFIKEYLELDLDAVTRDLNSAYCHSCIRLMLGKVYGCRGTRVRNCFKIKRSSAEDTIRELAWRLAFRIHQQGFTLVDRSHTNKIKVYAKTYTRSFAL